MHSHALKNTYHTHGASMCHDSYASARKVFLLPNLGKRFRAVVSAACRHECRQDLYGQPWSNELQQRCVAGRFGNFLDNVVLYVCVAGKFGNFLAM